MFFSSLDELAHHEIADHHPGEIIAPGVVIERRTILKFALSAAGALATAPAIAQSEQDQIPYEQLLGRLQPMAEALVKAEIPNEPAYLKKVEEILSRVSDIPKQPIRGKRAYAMHAVHRRLPLVVYQIRMEPGACIKLHDHRQYNGVLLGMSGQARCRNFDFVTPKTERGKEFLIRETARSTLRPGVTSTLSRTTNNLHEVTAGPEGARLFDVFTMFSSKAGSNWLEFNDRSLPDRPKTYRVRWR